AAREALDGSVRLILVEAEAGLGKTRLLDELATSLVGVRLGRAAGSGLQQHPPYLPLAPALRDAPPPLRTAPPPTPPLPPIPPPAPTRPGTGALGGGGRAPEAAGGGAGAPPPARRADGRPARGRPRHDRGAELSPAPLRRRAARGGRRGRQRARAAGASRSPAQ